MTPQTIQRTAFHKNRCTNTGTIIYRKFLDIEYCSHYFFLFLKKTCFRTFYLHPENRTVKQLFVAASACILHCLTFRSSPRLISIGQLHALLRLHLRPINDIVYVEPYSIKDERSNLRESFTLRCFQRLSRPDVATQLCPWQDNWCTRGLSIPVLSY